MYDLTIPPRASAEWAAPSSGAHGQRLLGAQGSGEVPALVPGSFQPLPVGQDGLPGPALPPLDPHCPPAIIAP